MIGISPEEERRLVFNHDVVAHHKLLAVIPPGVGVDTVVDTCKSPRPLTPDP